MPIKVYNIPPGSQFLENIAHGIFAKYGHNPLLMSDIRIFLPNHRSCQKLRSYFSNQASDKAIILPKIHTIGDIGEENFILKSQNNLTTPIQSFSKQYVMLANIIITWHKERGEKIHYNQAINLAIELSKFASEVERQQISWQTLQQITPEDLAEHRQEIIDFMEIIFSLWPKELQKHKLADINTYKNDAILNLSQYWQENPIQTPVFIAGSTGSIKATASLIKTIASLPHGYVILPGLDKNVDANYWHNIQETHPQYNLKKLIEYINIQRDDIKIWPYINRVINRDVITAEITRPANTNINWHNIQIPQNEYDNIFILNTNNIPEEANTIAIILRETIEQPNHTAVLITNNKVLARYVENILKKWDIIVDNSHGNNLSSSSVCIFLRLIISLAENPSSLTSFLACVKHPFSCFGENKITITNILNNIEIKYLRGVKIIHDLSDILNLITNDTISLNLSEKIVNILTSFTKLFKEKNVSFKHLLQEHIKLAEAMASTNTASGNTILWQNESGKQSLEFIKELMESADEIGVITPKQYLNIFDTLISGKIYHEKKNNTSRIIILSPIEARMLSFDTVILGDLNDGSWPQIPDTGPWMNRIMRKNFHLPSPDVQIGQSAHDFIQHLNSKRVIITRSKKSGKSNTKPSRWLQRMETVYRAANISEERSNNIPYLYWARQLNSPTLITSIPPARPNPPLATRPHEISISMVEELIRNPYAFYAKQILKLKKLEELEAQAGPKEFGILIHNIIQQFTLNYKLIDKANYASFLEDTFKNFIKSSNIQKAIENAWWPKFKIYANILAEKASTWQGVEIYPEINGKMQTKLANGNIITLKCRADRIEIAQEKIRIIDYKTSSEYPNIEEQALTGMLPQMPLQGLIAKSGGFCGIDGMAEALIYWFIGTDRNGNLLISERNVFNTISLEEGLAICEESYIKLLNTFFANQNAFLSAPNPKMSPKYNDYEHLARNKEFMF